MQDAVVLCHNDIEPRHILAMKSTGSRGSRLSSREDQYKYKYDLAGIVDWRMAGFYPFAFETADKDVVLGNCNHEFGWYRLFKDRTARFLRPSFSASSSSYASSLHEAQELLMRAMALVRVATAKSEEKTGNLGTLMQVRWLEREKVVRSDDLAVGFVREPKACGVRRFRKEDNEELVACMSFNF
ncbi:hypothetical protein BDW74DRAFT_179567 [Aspergillus multicolor]|uniref:uncharacterized protein n=1 Tax=Aspergillus multicolor TaxID=41759 RepID=UPI003CCCA134